LVDLGTASCIWTRKFAAAVSKHGLRFADAPVTGLEQRAREGTLTIMYGGDASLLEVIRPALACIGSKIIPMGSVGSGQLAKMINNILYNTNMAALAEVLPMAVKLGLGPEVVVEVINSGSGRSFASEYFIPKILENRFQDSYRLNDAFKDMAHAMQVSSLHRVPLPVVQAAISTYQTAIQAGWGDEDKGAMIKVYETLLGVTFRKKSY
jgi:3-hydroxyisobutyrate dehydrogenase-like beta-hydroxyacid dehydrogenase